MRSDWINVQTCSVHYEPTRIPRSRARETRILDGESATTIEADGIVIGFCK
jgi:hypothetical protein